MLISNLLFWLFFYNLFDTRNFPSKDNFEKKSNLNEIKEKCGAVLSTAQYALGKRIKQRNNWPKRTEQRVEQADRCNEEKEEGEEDESREQSPKSSSPKTIVSNRSIGKKKKKRNKKSLFQLKSEVLRSRFQRPTLLQKVSSFRLVICPKLIKLIKT
jgi:hypothetical protein